MNDAIAVSQTDEGLSDTLAAARPPQGGRDRVVLVGQWAFVLLKRLQERAPAPRLDMRYLIEGSLAALRTSGPSQQAWLDAAQEAMYQHVATRRHLAVTQVREPASADSGTDRSHAVQGALARTPATPRDQGHKEPRHEDCKALQIGEGAFRWLKGVQGTTRDPRLELRYLVEGAVRLLQQDSALLPAVVGHARQALAEHLVQLHDRPVEPFHLEHTA